MNRALLRHTWRVQRAKLAIVSIALAAWGFLLAVVYARFGSQFTALMQSGMLPEQFARFGGGDVFSLAGSIALGLIHPIAISLTSVFAVGFSAAAVAGERQRGTLEVALARPLSRRVLYLSLLAASFGFIAVVIAMYVLEVLGSLWPAAAPLQPYSLFHYLKAKAILSGAAAPADLVVLSSVILMAMVWALVVFPRRDLA